MEVFPASVLLIIRALVVSARWAEGPNAGWVVDALEGVFLRHGPPKHIISDQEGVFVSEVFRDLLSQWDVRQRFGAVGRHMSIAVPAAQVCSPTSSAACPLDTGAVVAARPEAVAIMRLERAARCQAGQVTPLMARCALSMSIPG